MDNEQIVARDPITYEYRLEATPKFTTVEEGWELIDVFPNRKFNATYILIFRKELSEIRGIRNAPR